MKRVPVLALILAVAVLCTLSPSARALSAPDDMTEVFSAQSLPQSDVFQPAPVLKCGPVCFAPVYTTATISGSGSSCTAAQTSLNSQLQSIAAGYCQNVQGDIGSCSLVVTNTTACTMISPGAYQIQGFAKHHCRDTNC